MEYQIPEKLVNILKQAGYNDIISIENMNNQSYEELEQFVSQNTNLFQCPSNSSSIKLLPGDKTILRALPKYVAEFKSVLNSANNDVFSGSYIMKELVRTAKMNCDKTRNRNRYSDKLRDFAIYIYIMCGKACYEILSHNLTLPQPSTICRYIQNLIQIIQIIELIYLNSQYHT